MPTFRIVDVSLYNMSSEDSCPLKKQMCDQSIPLDRLSYLLACLRSSWSPLEVPGLLRKPVADHSGV